MAVSKTHPVADKREAILDAALDLLASCGFHGFSIKQLADRAGVATGTVYLYFKDREDLISQLHSDIVQMVADAVFIDHDPQAELIQQYRLMCRNLWLFYLSHPRILLAKTQFDHLPPELLRSQIASAWNVFSPLSNLFATGRDNGQIKNLPNHVLFGLSIDSFNFLARQQLLNFIDIDAEQFEVVVQASWDAIAVQTKANLT